MACCCGTDYSKIKDASVRQEFEDLDKNLCNAKASLAFTILTTLACFIIATLGLTKVMSMAPINAYFLFGVGALSTILAALSAKNIYDAHVLLEGYRVKFS